MFFDTSNFEDLPVDLGKNYVYTKEVLRYLYFVECVKKSILSNLTFDQVIINGNMEPAQRMCCTDYPDTCSRCVKILHKFLTS